MPAAYLPSTGIKPDVGNNGGAFKLKKEHEGLSLRELEKKAGAGAILKMKREAPELYAQMYMEQYGKEPRN